MVSERGRHDDGGAVSGTAPPGQGSGDATAAGPGHGPVRLGIDDHDRVASSDADGRLWTRSSDADGRLWTRSSGVGDRAQLILVGAIAIGLVILGLSVILNTVVFTESVSPRAATTGLEEAREFDREARTGVGRLVLRLNHRDRNHTEAELSAAVHANVTNYSRAYTESYANSRGVIANLSYDGDDSAFGRRVVQTGDANLTADATGPFPNAENWVLVPDSQRRTVGWFTTNVDVRNTSTEATTVLVTNESGGTVNVTLYRVGSGSSAGLNVSTDVSFAGETTVTCDPSRGRVLLDLVEGRSVGGGCQFNGTRVLTPPYDIEVENGNNVVGRYEVVVNESVTTATGAYGQCGSGGPPGTQPCASPVVWTANVTVEFVGTDLAYSNTDNVTIYREAP